MVTGDRPIPLWLLAEVTYRCPLACPYCSNPEGFAGPRFRDELTTAEWGRVLDEARALGVLQLGWSGGEPTVRRDLEALVTQGRRLGFYQTLVTSAYQLPRDRLAALRTAGLDHLQVSVQAADPALSDEIAGVPAWERKLDVCRAARALGLPLTLNVVLHHRNLHQVRALTALAVALGADRLELANTQYYGWALRNRRALLPTREALDAAWHTVLEERARLGQRLEIVWVVPDYHDGIPKPCMGGWGQAYLTVTPAGEVWPCQAAGGITTLHFANVRDHPLAWIWQESDAFTRFRGEHWMPEPCRSCPRRAVDFGGCRCQAFALTGDAGVTDPVCALSPHRPLVDAALAAGRASGPWVYRRAENARGVPTP